MSDQTQTLAPQAAAVSGDDTGDHRRESLGNTVQKYGTPAGLLLLLILFFSFATSNFASIDNFRNILIQIAPLLIVAVGVTIPMAAGDYDLSVGGNAGLVGLLCTGLLANGTVNSVALVVVIGILVGASIGVINGFLIAWIGFPSLIATLAMMSVLEGVNTAYSGGLSIFNGIPEGFTQIASTGIAYIPALIIIAAICALAAYLLMHRRPTGRHLYAVGSSFGVARLVGIRIPSTRLIAMVVSGVAAALAGILLSSRLGAGIPDAGDGFLLSSLTVVFLGMTMYRIGRANIPGTIVGAVFYGVLQNGLNIMGVESAGQKLATGLVLMAAVAFAVFRNRHRD